MTKSVCSSSSWQVTTAGRLAALARGPQVLLVALGGQGDHPVRGVEDRLRRAVVLLERQHLDVREHRGEVEDVAHVGGPERVDRLRVVADDRHPGPVGPQQRHDARLQRVGVLVLVDEHVVEPLADLGAGRRVLEQPEPVEQDVVVVEHAGGELALDVLAAQPLQVVLVLQAPGERRAQHVAERPLRVHGAAVDVHAGPLLREPAVGARQAELRAHDAHEVLGVAAVEDREPGVERDRRAVQAQQPRAHRVEGAAPHRAAPGSRVPSPRSRRRMPSTRRVISWAARRVKVSSRMRRGSMPLERCHATRWASVVVLPVPAPATMSSGESPWVTASYCALLSWARTSPIVSGARSAVCMVCTGASVVAGKCEHVFDSRGTGVRRQTTGGGYR